MTEQNFFRTSDGKWIYYEIQGEGIPIIMIPGHMCSTEFFSKNAVFLSQYFQVILFDPRGYGRSTKSMEGNTVRNHGRDIHELMEYLDLDKAAVFAWSLAGAALMSYIRDYGQKRLFAIGLIDTPLFPFSHGSWNSHRTKGYNINGWLDTYGAWVKDPRAYYQFFCRKLFLNPPEKADEDWIIREVSRTMPWTGLALHLDFCHLNFVPDLEKLDIPVAVSAGVSANFPKAVEMSQEYMKHLNSESELNVYEQGGHMLFYLESDKFNAQTYDFLSRVLKRPMTDDEERTYGRA